MCDAPHTHSCEDRPPDVIKLLKRLDAGARAGVRHNPARERVQMRVDGLRFTGRNCNSGIIPCKKTCVSFLVFRLVSHRLFSVVLTCVMFICRFWSVALCLCCLFTRDVYSLIILKYYWRVRYKINKTSLELNRVFSLYLCQSLNDRCAAETSGLNKAKYANLLVKSLQIFLCWRVRNSYYIDRKNDFHYKTKMYYLFIYFIIIIIFLICMNNEEKQSIRGQNKCELL